MNRCQIIHAKFVQLYEYQRDVDYGSDKEQQNAHHVGADCRVLCGRGAIDIHEFLLAQQQKHKGTKFTLDNCNWDCAWLSLGRKEKDLERNCMAHHLVVIGKILSKGINNVVEVTGLIVLLQQRIADYIPGIPISDKVCTLRKKPLLVHCGETGKAGAKDEFGGGCVGRGVHVVVVVLVVLNIVVVEVQSSLHFRE